MSKITSIKAKEIKDSRGKPTIEVEVGSGSIFVSASVPSGASTGSREAKTVFVDQAISNIEKIIAPKLLDMEVNPIEIDKILLELDHTEDKSNLGGNTLLGVSLAVTRLGAKLEDKPLWKYINEISKVDTKPSLPKLFMNVINGGVHADFRSPFQEYMIIEEDYNKAKNFISKLGVLIKEKYEEVEMGDEGGYSPKVETIREPFELLTSVDENIEIAIDVAGSELYKEGQYEIFKKTYSPNELLEIYEELIKEYPIKSIEDPFEENDFESFQNMVKEFKDSDLIIVGDDLTTTNPESILESARNKRVNAVIIKPNQIGTLTEVYNAIKLARGAGWEIICSHRSGETMDTFIADLAVGVGAYGIKAGSPSQNVRRVKYDRIEKIKQELSN